MSVILLVLGILVTGLGAVAVGFGIPASGLALGQTLITTGATALVGGLVLIGLAAAVTQLTAIAEALKVRPATRAGLPAVPAEAAPKVEEPRAVEPRMVQPRPAEPRPAEPRPPEPAPQLDVSANAIERLRSSIARPDRVVDAAETVPLSPNGSGHHPAEPVPPAPEPKLDGPIARTNGSGGEHAKEPHLDFLFRSRAPRPAAPAETFDAMWPKRAPRGTGERPKAEDPPPPRPAAPPAPTAEERRPPVVPEQRSVAILKSGVVDGMAYTLYADGSIEAQLPQGTVRFGSIAELRAHIENNS